jgi:hypothetical protein
MLPTWPYPDRPGGSFERLRMVTVHASPRMETVWLDD